MADNAKSRSLRSIRGIQKESKELAKQAKILENKISKNQVTPDGNTVVRTNAVHGKLLRFKKQIAQETLRLERKKK